jgi:hypothetical protein
LYDSHCIGTNYDSGGRFFNADIFNDLFFMSEYYDNVIRSASREHFRWMLESKGYNIQYNNEIIENNDIIITISNRVLYSKYESLTDPEKIIYEKAKNYAKFLNIDFNSKVAKKKSEDILLSDKLFIKHFAFRMLTDDVPTKKQMKKQYNILVSNSLYIKVNLIKQLEQSIGIKLSEINTRNDVDRFDEVIEIDELDNMIKKIFRFSKTVDINDLKLFKYWYYRLIQMYKHIFGENIFKCDNIMENKNRYYSYSIDDMIYNNFKNKIY